MDKYAQRKDWTCGPAALSYALSKVGIDVDQEQLEKDTKCTEKGVDPEPMKKAAEKYGAEVEELNGESPEKTLQVITQAVNDGASVIVDYVMGGKKDSGHYVVFLGQKEGKINVWNPSGGKKDLMEKTYFIQNWRDRTEDGKILKNWAMVIRA